MMAALESLLRTRKLDVTVTTAAERVDVPPDRFASCGDADLDAAMGGGFRRGHVSEIVGAASTGRTTLVTQALVAATARGEAAALVDVCDTFDPPSAAARGVDLARVLWVRETGDAVRALRAYSLILQAGGFGLAVFDLADVQPAAFRRFPFTTWLRLARTIEGSETVALLAGSTHISRSPRGVTIALAPAPQRWTGAAHRARLFAGVTRNARVVTSGR
jgi:hypothetical protein